MTRFRNVAIKLSRAMNWVACIAVAAMMVLTCSDVVGRYLGHPVRGGYDLTGLFAIVIYAFPLAYTQFMRGHVAVDFLAQKLPNKLRGILAFIISFFSLGLFLLIVWQSFELGNFYLENKKVTMTEHIPLSPFVYGVSLACVPLCMVLLIDMVDSIKEVFRK